MPDELKFSDARIRRSAVNTLEVDDGAGGAVSLNVVGAITDDGQALVNTNDPRLTDTRDPNAHPLVGADHTVSGLTAGHVLTATGPTTFAFEAATGGGSSNTAINGGMRFWQRQADPATLTSYDDGDYGPDRWKILSSAANVVQAQRIDGNRQRYACRLKQTSSTARQVGAVQYIEGKDCRHLRGQTVTLSARVQCSATATINIAVLEWTGTEDALSNDPVGSWAATPTWAANFSAPGTVGSETLSANTWTDIEQTVTLGSTFNNLALVVWSSDALAQNATLDIEGVQLERGDAATPFEVRPTADELALCQRYFERLGGNIAGEQLGPGFARTVNVFFCFIQYQQKRTTPSVSYTGTFDISTVGVVSGSIVATNDIGPTSFFNEFENVGAFTAGYAGALRAITTSSYIYIDAEL